MVLVLAKYGSLLSYLDERRYLNESDCQVIMGQLLLTADLMHRRGLVHRDIKPENVLLYDKKDLRVCIADLGLACRADDERELRVTCGTPGYVGPEILKGGSASPKSDIFSLGSFLFNMVTGRCLFRGSNMKEILF